MSTRQGNEVRATIEIAAPPQRLWEKTMDPRCLSEWVSIHRKLNKHDDGPAREGFQMQQTLALAGAPFKVRWTLTTCEEPRHAIWEGKGPAGSKARTEYTFTETENGTKFDYVNAFSAPGGALGRVASRVLVGGISQREANSSLQNLKKLLES